MTLRADPYVFAKSHWCSHLGGLGDGVINSRGEPPAHAARSNQGRKVRPTVAAAQGPKDELLAQRNSSSCPTGGNPCVGIMDSSESNVRVYHSLLRQFVQSVYGDTRTHMCMCIYTHTMRGASVVCT